MTDVFARFETDISDINKKIGCMLAMAENLSADCFDNEDRRMVVNKIQALIIQKDSLEKQLKYRKDIYNTKVKVLEKHVKKRKKLLDGVKNIQYFPDILDFFAEKQAKMQSELEIVKNQITK